MDLTGNLNGNETSTLPQASRSLANVSVSRDISPDNTTNERVDKTTGNTSDQIMDDLQEGWQEVAKKRPGSPKLAEKAELEYKRRSRSTRRSK